MKKKLLVLLIAVIPTLMPNFASAGLVINLDGICCEQTQQEEQQEETTCICVEGVCFCFT